jgi:hypothetical protein
MNADTRRYRRVKRANRRLVTTLAALLHDVQIGSFDANLNTVGLRYRDGRPKPGYERFRALRLR